MNKYEEKNKKREQNQLKQTNWIPRLQYNSPFRNSIHRTTVWLQSNLLPLGRETFQGVNVLLRFVREANRQGRTVEIAYICRRETIRCLAGMILQNSGLEFCVSLTAWPLRDKLQIKFHLCKSRVDRNSKKTKTMSYIAINIKKEKGKKNPNFLTHRFFKAIAHKLTRIICIA